MGLTMYNGTSFTTYNTTNSTLKSDTVISLACNSGNIYAGTYKGLSVYNGTNFTNYNHAGSGMKSDTVYCITVESTSAIWLGNKYGIDKFNGSNFTFSYVTAGNIADTVNCIYLDSVNNKWIGTNYHGLIKYDNTNFYTLQQLYPNPNIQQDFIGVSQYWPVTVKNICKGLHGGVFIGMDEYILPFSGILSALTGSIEITGSQLYQYPGYASGVVNPTSSYFIMQHDLASNILFFIIYGAGGASGNIVLYSYNPSLYTDNPPYDITNTNSAFLDINNVNALITDNSNQHWDTRTSETKYFVSKQNNTSPLHGSSMWIGGFASGNLHMAAMTYRQNGYDFWPGPLNPATDAIDSATSQNYNQVWKVNRYDIANFLYEWGLGNVQSGAFVPPASITTWPGNSPYTGKPLAPYVDVNHNGVYDPIAGGAY